MKTMPNSTQEERLRWIQPILDKKIKIKDMVEVCPFSERTIKYWLADYRKYGPDGLTPKSSRPKTNASETPIRIKEKVIDLRKETGLSAQKLYWKFNPGIEVRTIGKIIKKEGLTRKYRTKKIKYKYVKVPLRIGELMEVDIKYVPKRLAGRRYYQFTAIDCASRWRFLRIYDDKSTFSAMRFLKELTVIAQFKIKAVKTDNDSCFTNRYTGYLKSTDPFNPRIHAFDKLCAKMGIIHYLIDPGKPQQNGKVERSHRTDNEHFYQTIDFQTEEELKYKIRLWNMYYNDLEHCGLNGKTPNQVLRLGVQNVCA
jgi:transposase InsO family protein